MGFFADDSVDHDRTSRQRVGEAFKNSANAPGLLAIVVSVAFLALGLFAFADAQMTLGAAATIGAVLIGGAGLTWLLYTHRRVREAQLRWHMMRFGDSVPPPES